MSTDIRGRWRRAIGWIAVYALALQTVLAGPLGSSFALGDWGHDGAPAFALCVHDGDSSAPDSNPAETPKSHLHCWDCCLGAAPVIAPTKPPLLGLAIAAARKISFSLADWRSKISVGHPSRPPRGPPLPA